MKIRGLLTGASGFLGKAIFKGCSEIEIKTLGRNDINDIIVDLSLNIPKIEETFDVVIHAAGKAHLVPKSIEEKQAFFDVNVNGTKNLLFGLNAAKSLPKSFIYISSVSVYGRDSGTGIAENTPLNASDPYGCSKIEAEKIVKDWCDKNSVICCILRLPLLIGINPPGNLGAMIRGIKKGYYFNIAGGNARKSMILTEDVVKIIPIVMDIGGTYNLTDGYHPTFAELALNISAQCSKRRPLNISYFFAGLIGKMGDILGDKFPINTVKLKKITSDLTFDDTKARTTLKWDTTPVLKGIKIKQ